MFSPVDSFSDYLESRKKVLRRILPALVVAVVAAIALSVGRKTDSAGLRETLLARGLADLEMLEVPGSGVARKVFDLREHLVTGKLHGEANRDVFHVLVRNGTGIVSILNLTRSPGADEDELTLDGHYARFMTRIGRGEGASAGPSERYEPDSDVTPLSADEETPRSAGGTSQRAGGGPAIESITWLDTRGEAARVTAGWSVIAKAQNWITNVQETGRGRGFDRVTIRLATPSPDVALERKGESILVVANRSSTIELDAATLTLRSGHSFAERVAREKGRPGSITWVVDTVRRLPFVGAAPIEWLEHKVFGAKDWVERLAYRIRGARDRKEEGAETRRELAGTSGAQGSVLAGQGQLALRALPPSVGWPPASLTALITPALDGEGAWVPVTSEFVQKYPNAPPAFVQTYLRADPERPFAKMYITLWDARQVQLNIAMGTREPESATGETGSGLVPRTEATMRRLVGGFNGGFQAMHGEFGMMAEGRVYIPPKPWAATVAVYQDGRVALGAWPGPALDARGHPVGEYDEARATREIPADMISMRQNLSSVVEGDRFNPWERWWWGAAPVGATEQTFTHRSGLCLTSEGFLAFFWGGTMDADALGRGMLATRCVRGMHLDMNSRHTGFDFYRVAKSDELSPPSSAIDPEVAFEGPLPSAEGLGAGWIVRSQKAVASMVPMRFPRYIHRDARDFFYLTLRPVLPGPDVAGPSGAIRFSTGGLPHAGWPYAFARADAAVGGVEAKVTRIDLARLGTRRVAPGGTLPTDALGVVSRSSAGPREQCGVAWNPTPIGRELYVSSAPREDVVIPTTCSPATSRAEHFIGIDREGFVVWFDSESEVDPSAAARTMASEHVFGLAHEDDRLGFVTADGVSDPLNEELDFEAGIAFLPGLPPSSILAPDNQPMPYAKWGRLQGARVRYFPTGPPRFVRPPGAR